MADISKEMAVQLARESKVIPAVIQSTTCQHFDYIRALTQAAFKLGRNAGLEEAKQVAKETCSHDATLFGDGFNTAALVIERAIESLKDNTP